MKIQVLISCMHQKDHSIITKTNIQTDVLIVNQCDSNNIEEFSFLNKKGNICKALFISTTERGLSNSRNLAIENSSGDICLICDDDEILEDDYEDKIIEAFNSYNDDIIAFKFGNPNRKYSNKTYQIGFFLTGKVGSVQIAFRHENIITKGIRFNPKMGSGTGNGAGEENKFLVDCIKCGLKIRYIPVLIGSLTIGNKSNWFSGYNEKYWINRGWQSRMIYGSIWGYIYLWYGLRHAVKDKNNSLWSIIKWLHHGFVLKR